jgi:hypothetical protein
VWRSKRPPVRARTAAESIRSRVGADAGALSFAEADGGALALADEES